MGRKKRSCSCQNKRGGRLTKAQRKARRGRIRNRRKATFKKMRSLTWKHRKKIAALAAAGAYGGIAAHKAYKIKKFLDAI